MESKAKTPMISIGDLIKTTWNFYVKNFKNLMLLTLLLLIPLIVVSFISFIPFLETPPTSISITIIGVLAGLAFILITMLIGAYITVGYIRLLNNDKLTIGKLIKHPWKVFLQYILVSICKFLFFLLLYVPTILFVLITLFTDFSLAMLLGFVWIIVVGPLFYIYLFSAEFIVVSENIGPINALKKSYKLVKDYWWRILLRYIIMILLLILASVVFAIVSFSVGFINDYLSMVIDIARNILLTPFVTIYPYFIYRNLKMIKRI